MGTVHSYRRALSDCKVPERFLRETKDGLSVFEEDFDPCALCCLRKVDSAKPETHDQVEHSGSDRPMSHRLNCLCIALSIVGMLPRAIELMMGLGHRHL